MTFSIGFLIYVMIWVVMLFLILPWGVRMPDKMTPGQATSAPENPYIGLKILITSVLSSLLWIVAYFILKT